MKNALDHFPAIAVRLRERPPVLFLDYDGTLTPIVDDPAAADLDPDMRERVRRVAARIKVAVISGRDLPDVRARVGIDGLFYAGNHGFDIEGPAKRLEQPEAPGHQSALDRADAALREGLGSVPGVLIERKRFSVAVHYRRAVLDSRGHIDAVVGAVAGREGLGRSGGKQVFEVQPSVPWDKGRALRWLLEAQGLEAGRITPVYIGDDLTDEDAFRALPQHGIGILVGEHGAPSAARYRLADPQAVGRWLEALAAHALGEGVRALDFVRLWQRRR